MTRFPSDGSSRRAQGAVIAKSGLYLTIAIMSACTEDPDRLVRAAAIEARLNKVIEHSVEAVVPSIPDMRPVIDPLSTFGRERFIRQALASEQNRDCASCHQPQADH